MKNWGDLDLFERKGEGDWVKKMYLWQATEVDVRLENMRTGGEQ